MVDPQAIQRQVLASATAMFGCGSGVLCLRDDQTALMRAVTAVGAGSDLPVGAILEATPVQAAVLAERRTLVLPDPRLTLGERLAGTRGLAIVPLLGAERVLGVLMLADFPEGREVGDADVPLMSAVAAVAATVLESRQEFITFRQEMGRRITEAMAELSRAGAELQRLKTFNEELFDSAPVGIIVFDREFRVTFRNSAADRLWPEDRSILGAARRTDVARRDAEWESGLRDVIHMQQPWRAEDVTFDRPGGEAVRVNLSCSPLLSGRRKIIGGVLIVEDVTQRVHMERRLAVSERLAGVGRLAATVAHEINNPLDGIIRLVNLARRVGAEAGDERTEKYLAEANKGLMRMVMIVRDLLEFSRSASGSVDPMPIRDIMTEVSHVLAPAAEKSKVEIAIDCDDDLPLLESGTLYQVVLNLVKNAIEAMPGGGRVDVRARTTDGAIAIEVGDTGPGIPPEVLARLFEPFYTLKATGKGTGLGLVICKDLVEKQGGTVVASNRPDGGAMFTVRIPVATGRDRGA
jgi:PAS domain S-box-containing protein